MCKVLSVPIQETLIKRGNYESTDDYECGCGVDDLQPCDSDFSKCLAAYKDPASGRFVSSKDEFVIAEEKQ